MDDHLKKECLEQGFADRKTVEEAIGGKLKEIETDATRVHGIFRNELDKWKKERLCGRKFRFVATIEVPPSGKLTKGVGRIAEKILESRMKYEQWEQPSETEKGKAPERHDLDNFLEKMGDVVRFRIKCNYLDDVRFIDEKLKALFTRYYEIISIADRKDFIDTPYPDRRVGHRAIQYTLRYNDVQNPFLFEVQIMTQLQHAWDKKDHHLVYERVRDGDGEKIPNHLKNRVAAMSELLYVADITFDELRQKINEETGEE